MKNIIKLYTILFAIFVVVLVVLSSGTDEYMRTQNGIAYVQKIEYNSEEEGIYRATYDLPDDVEGQFVCYLTHHIQSKVWIGDELVYKVEMSPESKSKSTGYRMNLISLKKQDGGKKMTILMESRGSGGEPEQEIYVGQEVGIYKLIFREDALRLLLVVIVFIIGILLFGYSMFVVKLKNIDVSIVHFAVFCISLALWAFMETPIASALQRWNIERMVLDHYMLMLMPMTFALYVRNIYNEKNKKIWTYCFNLLFSVMILRTVLQVFFGVSLKETLLLTQISIIMFACLGLFLTIREVKQKDVSRRLKINLVCIVVIMIATATELGYYSVNIKSPAFGMIGFLIYVVVIGYDLIKHTRKQMAMANKADKYRDMAYMDELTKVHSRMAFHKHMQEFDDYVKRSEGKRKKNIAVVMFDLNDLKKCNDNFGHEFGDRYLTAAADMLNDVFGDVGSCYRIGGDEFSVLMLYQDESMIQEHLEILRQRMDEFNAKGFVVNASVASGYALFDEALDENLEHTMARADAMMYETKKAMKNQGKVNR